MTQTKVEAPFVENNRPFRNLIINGAFQVAQRGTSSTSNNFTTVDRWGGDSGGTNESPTFAQVNVASGTTPYTLGFRKAYSITNGNQTGGANAGDYMGVNTRLEAQYIANSGWNYTSTSSYITLSFWVKSSVAQNFYGYLLTSDGTAQIYPFETGSLSADTWTKVTKTIPGNSNLTINNDNGIGLQLQFWSFLGTTYTSSVTLNQWAAYASGTRTPNNTSTWYTTNDATFEITGVQLEVGDAATDFEHLPFDVQLERCKRYFENYEIENGGGLCGISFNASTSACTLVYKVTKRVAPTVGGLTASRSDGLSFLTNAGSYANSDGSLASHSISVDQCRINGSSYSDLTNPGATLLYSTGDQTITLDAEL
jgi:hypothetical protein